MSETYFSDREFGARPRDVQEMTPTACRGIVGAVESLIEAGAFGLDFPERCSDGYWTIGTDRTMFGLAVQGEIPDLEWPLRTTTSTYSSLFGSSNAEPYAPSTAAALDFLAILPRPIPLANYEHSAD